ncbi:MAG TPA: DUF2510 domain-containing protein [Galbitalea sp.]|nr:DUF2510 domain-containing protein [Galbitalea sp.]
MPDEQPSGWYPNPFDATEELFWDGRAWTGEKRPVPQPVEEVLPTPPKTAAAPVAPAAAIAAPTVAIDQAPPTAPVARSKNTLGLVALILGIVGLVFGIIPGLSFLAWIFALPAIGLGIAGLVKKGVPHGRALAGLIEGAVAMIVGIIISSVILASPSVTDASDDSAAAPTTTHVTSTASPSTSTASTPTVTPTPTAKPKTSGSAYGVYPAAEAQFVSITAKTEKALDAPDTTDLQRATLVSSRDAQLCKVTARRATNWVGKISDIGANGDGYAYVEVEIAPTMNVQTWNNDFSDAIDNTLIKPSAPFFSTLVPMKVGQKVVFSGTFLTSSKSCLEGANITQTFYGIDPNFILRFSAVRAG